MTLVCRTVVAAGCLFWLAVAAVGQQAGPPGPKFSPFSNPFSNPYGRSFQWLANPQVQEELKLTDDQWDRIKEAQEATRQKVRELYKSKELNELEVQKRQQAYRERIQSLSDAAEQQSQAILSKDQAARLKQIILQRQMGWGSHGVAGVLLDKGVDADLHLTDQQREQLRQKQAEVQQEAARKTQEFYRKLQQEAREKLLSVLTAEQQKKLESLLGPKFELRPFPKGERKTDSEPRSPARSR